MLRLGVDVGGTFTDFVLFQKGKLTVHKLPTTVHDQAEAMLLCVGSLGVGGAVVLEMVHHEPIYELAMKVFPWVFGLGAVLLGLCLRRR